MIKNTLEHFLQGFLQETILLRKRELAGEEAQVLEDEVIRLSVIYASTLKGTPEEVYLNSLLDYYSGKKVEDIYNMKIDDIEFSVRAANALYEAKLRYVGELIMLTEGDLLMLRCFGKKSLQEVKNKLSELDPLGRVHLGTKMDYVHPSERAGMKRLYDQEVASLEIPDAARQEISNKSITFIGELVQFRRNDFLRYGSEINRALQKIHPRLFLGRGDGSYTPPDE